MDVTPMIHVRLNITLLLHVEIEIHAKVVVADAAARTLRYEPLVAVELPLTLAAVLAGEGMWRQGVGRKVVCWLRLELIVRTNLFFVVLLKVFAHFCVFKLLGNSPVFCFLCPGDENDRLKLRSENEWIFKKFLSV